MRRALLLGGGLAALAVGWAIAASPTITNTVAIVDATNPAAPNQAGVDSSGNLKVNCTTGCSAGSGTGANNADGVASVSTGLGSSVGYGFVYNGTTWDRQTGSASRGTDANIKDIGGAALALGQTTMAASLPVAIASNQGNLNVAVAAALPAGANTIGAVTQSGTWNIGSITTLPALATGANTIGAVTQASGPWTMNLTQANGTTLLTGTGAQGAGSPRVTVATDSATVAGSASLPAGSNIVGKVGIDQTTPGTTNGVTIAPSASATIGQTPVNSAAAENNHVLKASAGNLYGVYATNLTATAGFLVVLNATSAPADGAITPLACVPLTANGVASVNYLPGPPAVYSTGITAIVTSAATCFTKTTGTITAFIAGQVQ
jgi:hypothetical protein